MQELVFSSENNSKQRPLKLNVVLFCSPFKNKHFYPTLANAAAATIVVENENYPWKVSLNAACRAAGVLRCTSFGLLVARHKSSFTNFIKIFAAFWKPNLPMHPGVSIPLDVFKKHKSGCFGGKIAAATARPMQIFITYWHFGSIYSNTSKNKSPLLLLAKGNISSLQFEWTKNPYILLIIISLTTTIITILLIITFIISP